MTIERLFRAVLGLGFLPDPARRWIFGTGTRALEVLNIAALSGWSIVLTLDERLLELPSYKTFAALSESTSLNETLGALFAVMAVLCCAGLFVRNFRWRFLSGVAMLASALSWALVTSAFVHAYPPLSTAIVLYGALSIMCFLAGEHLIFSAQLDREWAESRPAALQ